MPNAAGWRSWLEPNHGTSRGVRLVLTRKGGEVTGLTYEEAVDEALCFGWIDGLRKSIDGEAYMIRFTPRRIGSIWSRVNLERVAVLIREGRMTPGGIAVYEARDPEKTGRYSFEQDTLRLSREQEREFRRHPEAWAFWKAQPPGYRKQATGWVVGAKREETRARRLETLIEDSANGLRIKELRRG